MWSDAGDRLQVQCLGNGQQADTCVTPHTVQAGMWEQIQGNKRNCYGLLGWWTWAPMGKPCRIRLANLLLPEQFSIPLLSRSNLGHSSGPRNRVGSTASHTASPEPWRAPCLPMRLRGESHSHSGQQRAAASRGICPKLDRDNLSWRDLVAKFSHAHTHFWHGLLKMCNLACYMVNSMGYPAKIYIKPASFLYYRKYKIKIKQDIEGFIAYNHLRTLLTFFLAWIYTCVFSLIASIWNRLFSS